MNPLKKRRDYSYYNSYNSGRGRIRKDRVLIVGVIGAILVVGLLVLLNLTRIKLLWKGYSLGESSEILSLTDEQESEILSHDKMDHILDWIKLSKEVSFYDEYEKYLGYYPKMEKEEVIAYIDEVFTSQVPKLKSLGYTETTIWDLLKNASNEDLQYLVDKGYTAQEIENYRKVTGYVIQNTHLYMDSYKENKDYNYSVNIVNYPFIIASNGVTDTYTIDNPEEVLTLVKKGFFLPSTYEPADLTTPNIPISPECEDAQMTKATATALEEMTTAADKEGYKLVLNSAYRSYDRQQAVYQEFETKYGGLYAAEYVAAPGASEHQTGLGIDLTSQSVLDGERLVFGDTSEYQWVLKNAHEYGFIVRFDTETADITGIAHEPWHLRYVGKEVAKEIYDKGWTFEEYCLYNNVIPKVTKN
ncbi:MAG: D-alanyl-D-alanine carboxypeptidase family protein [Coprobacillaceae bacterium]